MHTANFLGPWDTALLAAPFFALLAAWMFGLDELLATPRRKRRNRGFGLIRRNGRTLLTDPDGRPWRSASHLQSAEKPVENSNTGDRV
ncbi:MAG TPA: hypothetical protein VMD29_07230 [Terracidiphilus sp.]|nr:hypothetical protein [Terracidiphilus sp.]